MSKSFCVILPSSSSSYSSNKPSKFRVILPNPLKLEGEWLCGLSSIQIPHSWKTLGNDQTEFIDILLSKPGLSFRVPLPIGSYTTIQELEKLFDGALRKNFLQYKEHVDKLLAASQSNHMRKRRAVEQKETTLFGGKKKSDGFFNDEDDDEDEEGGPLIEQAEIPETEIVMEPNIRIYSKTEEGFFKNLTIPSKETDSFLVKFPTIPFPPYDIDGGLYTFEVLAALVGAVNFKYDYGLSRFQFNSTHPDVKYLALSNKLSTALGFTKHIVLKPGDIAKYSCDLSAGMSHICVHAKELVEDMIVGDSYSNLLQILSVNAHPGDVIDKTFHSPMLNKVASREIGEIEIHLRNLNGELIEFNSGIVIVTLCFKKALYF